MGYVLGLTRNQRLMKWIGEVLRKSMRRRTVEQNTPL